MRVTAHRDLCSALLWYYEAVHLILEKREHCEPLNLRFPLSMRCLSIVTAILSLHLVIAILSSVLI